MILGDDRPAVRKLADARPARIDHRLDGENHAGLDFYAGSGAAVMEHLRLLVEFPADAVAAELAHDGKSVFFGVGLDDLADVAQIGPMLHHLDSAPHAFVGYFGE